MLLKTCRSVRWSCTWAAPPLSRSPHSLPQEPVPSSLDSLWYAHPSSTSSGSLFCGFLAFRMFGRTKNWSLWCRGCQGSGDWWWCQGPSRSQRSPLSFVPLGVQQPQCDTGECKWPDSYIGSLIEDTPGPAAAPGFPPMFRGLHSAPSHLL